MIKNELSNVDIVLYVLFILGGSREKISTESIALECFKLVPSRFSWILHPEYPDMEPVRKALFAARSKTGGEFVAGRHGKTKENQISDGWIFTPKGISWIKDNEKDIGKIINKKVALKVRSMVDKQIIELKKTAAYQKYFKDKKCDDILEYDFTNFLNASLDTPSSILRDKVDKIKALSAESEELDILNLIEKLEEKFSNLFKK